MISRAPARYNKRAMFAPAAPAPFTTILAVAKSFLTKRRAPFTPAKHAIAVPCWSSWNTGISNSSFKRFSTS